MEKLLHNELVKMVIKLLAIVVGIYVFARYIVVLVWPVILGYIIALILSPCVRFLVEKCKYNRTVATLMVMLTFVVVFVSAGFFLGKMFVTQGKNLVENWNGIAGQMQVQVKTMCGGIEKGLSLDEGRIYDLVEQNYQLCVENGRKRIMSVIMDNSVSALVKTVEIIAGVIITIVAAFLFIRDEEEMKQKFLEFPFQKQVVGVSDKIKHLFKAYLRAQLVIMAVSVLVCFVGLTIIKNPYSLILAVVIGVLDALPFIGVGIVLLPWSLFYILTGLTKNGIVLLLTFVICYILREVLEPRLVGDKMGISPLMSLVTIYAGYQLFGIIGVVFGPLALIAVRECLGYGTKA